MAPTPTARSASARHPGGRPLCPRAGGGEREGGRRVIGDVLATVGGRVHTTKLVKLVYLVDYVYGQNFGQTATGFKYHWDHYGPNAVGHAVIRETEDLVNRGVVSCYQHISMYGTLAMMFKIADPERLPPLEPAKSA